MPPEVCGGPAGYQLMRRRQGAGPGLSDPSPIAASVGLLAAGYADELADLDLDALEELLTDGWKRVEA